MLVLLTGASGFAGHGIPEALAGQGYRVRAAVRSPSYRLPATIGETVALPDMRTAFDAAPLVSGCECVVHMAGLAHSSRDIPERDYMAVNCEAARTLAAAAAAAHVRTFVYVSSVRAQSGPGAAKVLTETDAPHPTDAYGRSKLAGERAVAEALAGSGTALFVLRPVLMYGPQPKGNMASLMRLARSPWPLPLGGLRARRSVLALENFTSAVLHALRLPPAAAGTYLLADGPAVTVSDILAAFREGLGRKSAIWNVSLPGAASMLTTLGQSDLSQRLFADLVVSAGAFAATGWQPAVASREALVNAIRSMG